MVLLHQTTLVIMLEINSLIVVLRFPNSEFAQHLKTRGTTTIIEQPSRNIDLDIDIFNSPLLDRPAVEDLILISIMNLWILQ